ncbi:hypothetical protein GWN49_04990 [Candidatus Bathyarchaeota archaeon]|nr:hypothetical protein [Candidatus Bathyarchaeota archaeon]
MRNRLELTDLIRLITQKTSTVTPILYGTVVVLFLNLNVVRSPILGVPTSILFMLISSIMIGQALFRNETPFMKLMLGNLIVIVTLGITGWIAMILHNLDNTSTLIVFLVTASIAAILNKRMNSSNGTE